MRSSYVQGFYSTLTGTCLFGKDKKKFLVTESMRKHLSNPSGYFGELLLFINTSKINHISNSEYFTSGSGRGGATKPK